MNSFMENSQDLEAIARGLAPRHGSLEKADKAQLMHLINRLNFAETLIEAMRKQIAERLNQMLEDQIANLER